MKVLIATPAYAGLVTIGYVGSLIDTLNYCMADNVEARWWTTGTESLIPRARNNAAAYALEQGFDRLFFIDADLEWTPPQFVMILRAGEAILGGTYPSKALPLRLNYNPLAAGGPGRSPEHLSKLPRNARGLCEVRHVPTGFLCIDVPCLRRLTAHAKPYTTHAGEARWDLFPTGPADDGSYESEDWGFCSLARAFGERIFLHPEVILPHTGVFKYEVKQ